MATTKTTTTPATRSTPGRKANGAKPTGRNNGKAPMPTFADGGDSSNQETIVHIPAIMAKDRPADAIPYSRDVIDVTPAKAAEWLKELHEWQRHEKPARVEMYAEDMIKGRWREDTEVPIIFDWYGNLIDGQNRLRGVVESGKTVKFVVVRGVDPDVMAVVDTGAARTVADAMRITGRGHDLSGAELNCAAAIARRSWHWQAGRRMRSTFKQVGAITHTAVGQILDSEKDIVPAMYAGIDAAKSNRPALVQAATYGFFYLMIMRIDSEVATRYHSFFVSPEDLPGGSPILAVRDRLYRSKLAQTGVSRGTNRAALLDQDEHLALLIRSWNLFAAGRPAPKDGTYLQVSKGALKNDNFPVPMTVEEAIKHAETLEKKGAWRRNNPQS